MVLLQNRLVLALLACLTLGLAPYFPEPHIVGKIRWVAGGADGLSAIDWFDLAMHGTPWLVLLGLTLQAIIHRLGRQRGSGNS